MTATEIALLITALGGFIAGIGGIIFGAINAKTTAKKTELDLLRNIIDVQDKEIIQLQGKLDKQETKIKSLEAQNERLRQRVVCLEKENRYLREKYENGGK